LCILVSDVMGFKMLYEKPNTNSVVEGKVRVFQKSIKRKLKDGDNVVILKLEDYNKLYENSKISKSTIKELNNVECYNNLQKTNEDLINEINRLRNKGLSSCWVCSNYT
jgi:hypothetical protein